MRTKIAGFEAGRRVGSALLLAIAMLTLTADPSGAKVRAPSLHVIDTCFTAKGPNGAQTPIFGRRFAVGRPSADTPAIVLVHGIASSADTWDFTRRWSVARWLAYAGYVVIAYDRIGYRRSTYDGDPADLTVAAQQSVIHDMVGQIHSGTYRTRACDRTASKYASRDVALIGHSSGGFIVSSYPGTYHDVAAMVQGNAPSGVSSTNPPGNAALLSASAQPAHGAMDDQFGPVGDPTHDGPAPTPPAGYTTGDLATRVGCEEFNLFRTGAVPSVATVMCNPANIVPYPAAETQSYVQQAIANMSTITRTGSTPVLLAGADHDGIMPGDANALELSGWQETCNCDVSQFILGDTGHAFMAHKSLVDWMTHVTRWLGEKQLRGRVLAHVVPGVFPPRACGQVRVRRHGKTRRIRRCRGLT